jgi:hypothetical protein
MSAADVGSFSFTRHVTLARVFLVIFGLLAVAWGLIVLPVFWQQLSIKYAATRIINDNPPPVERLITQIPFLNDVEKPSSCRGTALRSAAIIRLRIVEEALAAGARDLFDTQLNALSTSIRHSLSCSPADAYLWLALYWVENARLGFQPAHLAYLRMSYRVGPNEGWVATRRNRLAFAIFEHLPSDLAENAFIEFTNLVASDFYSDAASILTGPAWRLRNLILPRLSNVDERHRRNFSDILHSRNIEVKVPGIEREAAASRPW